MKIDLIAIYIEISWMSSIMDAERVQIVNPCLRSPLSCMWKLKYVSTSFYICNSVHYKYCDFIHIYISTDNKRSQKLTWILNALGFKSIMIFLNSGNYRLITRKGNQWKCVRYLQYLQPNILFLDLLACFVHLLFSNFPGILSGSIKMLPLVPVLMPVGISQFQPRWKERKS